jgi:hypothetical protein
MSAINVAERRYEDDVEAKAPRKRIPTQFDILQSQIGALNEYVEELIGRLQPILGEEYATQTKESNDREPRQVMSTVAETINDLASQVQRINQKLGSTLERIEV